MTRNYKEPHQGRLTAKMEAFARNVALKNQSFTDAYTDAYSTEKMAPRTVQTEAKRLAAHPLVAPRLELLRGRAEAAAVKRAALTLDDSLDEAGEMFDGAKAAGQFSAGVAAAKLRAQLAGHLSEKKEEHQGALTDIDVEVLLKMRDELVEKIKQTKEALARKGAQPEEPKPCRRVIG
ncbi:MAG: hypothetical protein NT123_24755 [Proteobacteria bacterium]|nr:hypothetical protein [Pseudomonadota bacterium]